MVALNDSFCPNCGGYLKYYDSVYRIVRTRKRITKKILLRRMRCLSCYKIHRELTNDILPFKQYEKEVVIGVIEGLIDSSTYGFEDYPCESTIYIWTRNLQGIL